MSKINFLDIYGKDEIVAALGLAYLPEWIRFTGGVTGSVLALQVLLKWEKNHREPFYQFDRPVDHPLYTKGGSWCEELGFNENEFETARNQIATKIDYKDAGKALNENDPPVVYWEHEGVTYYNINVSGLNTKLNELYSPKQPEIHKKFLNASNLFA